MLILKPFLSNVGWDGSLHTNVARAAVVCKTILLKETLPRWRAFLPRHFYISTREHHYKIPSFPPPPPYSLLPDSRRYKIFIREDNSPWAFPALLSKVIQATKGSILPVTVTLWVCVCGVLRSAIHAKRPCQNEDYTALCSIQTSRGVSVCVCVCICTRRVSVLTSSALSCFYRTYRFNNTTFFYYMRTTEHVSLPVISFYQKRKLKVSRSRYEI